MKNPLSPLPNVDCRLLRRRVNLFQSAIGNRKSTSPGLFLAGFARTLKRASLVALSELTSSPATLQRTLIRTQTSAAIDGQDAFDFGMGARNDVNADQFADSSSSRGPGVGGRLNSADVSANEDSHVARAYILFSQELNVSSFDHRVSGLDSADEAFGLHHSECF
jgi:hypothetical protein